MGLIRSALSAVGGTLRDSWREYFVCDALPSDVLVAASSSPKVSA